MRPMRTPLPVVIVALAFSFCGLLSLAYAKPVEHAEQSGTLTYANHRHDRERGPLGATADVVLDPTDPHIGADLWVTPGAEPGRPDPGRADPGTDAGTEPGDGAGGDGAGDAGPAPFLAALPPTETDDPLHLPDLVPRPAYDVTVAHTDGPPSHAVDVVLNEFSRPEEVRDGLALRFTTTIDNVGRYAFELMAVPNLPDPDSEAILLTDAFQCVRFEGPGIEGGQRACARYERVGTLTYHAHHRHFHIDGFASYQLRRDQGGRPMFGPGSVVASSGKVGWCVSDMETPRDANGRPIPRKRWYQECSGFTATPVTFRMGISPGWGDTYWHGFAGQQIPIDGVPDGIYWISIHINPPGNAFGLEIRESSQRQNMSFTKVRLFNGGTEVEVLS